MVALWSAVRWLLVRRQRARAPWPVRLLRSVERVGSAGHRPRRPDETPQSYCRALVAEGVVDDPRLVTVGEHLNAARYGPEWSAADDAARRQWCEAVVEAVR